MIDQQKKNRFLIVLIFGLSIVPVVIALILSKNSSLWGQGINNGQLIVPPIPTEYTEFTGFDSFSESNRGELTGHWLIVNVITQADCNESCLEAIIKTRQIRLMLNKELSRTRRVVMILESVDQDIASQWWLKDSLLWRLRGNNPNDESLYLKLLNQSNRVDEALITRLIGTDNREFALASDLIRIKPTSELLKKLQSGAKGQLTDGMLFLIDPIGNLMMRYDAGFDPYKVKNDLMHLLKISQIG